MDATSQAERVFQDQMPHFRQWQGWYALIAGSKLGGVFATYAAARAASQAMYGDQPTLIRQIPSTADVAVAAPATARKPEAATKRRKAGTDDERYVA